MIGGELRPARDDVAVVLRRLGHPRRVVDAIVIEKHAVDCMALRKRRLAEQVER